MGSTDGGPVALCRAPFASMEFGPDGSVLVCCANFLYAIGHVGQESLRDMWTGPAADRLRDALRRGDLSLGCTICAHRIRHDGAELPLLAYEHIEPTDGGAWPTNLSFSLHNTCNLECVMCGADRSSRIRSRRLGLPPLPHVYGDGFFDEVAEFVAHASLCDFVGGEPLLVREHWRVWEVMREVAPGMPTAITTNGTVWNARVEALLDDFPTTVRVSMDGITAPTFERIRVGADHAAFSANLERFHRYTQERGTDLTIAWSFVQQNWFELGEALVWAEERGIAVYVTTVIEREFGVQHLPTELLRRVEERMLRQSDEIRPLLHLNQVTWDRQLAMVATELAEREQCVVRDPCFEAPTDDAPRRAADDITRLPLPAAAAARRTDRPTAAGYAAGWSLDLDGADRLVCDAAGAVEAHRPGTVPLLAGLVPGRDTLEDVFDLLCARLGGRLWRVEEVALSDGMAYVVGIGPDVRDGSVPAVVRLVVRRGGSEGTGGLDIAVLGVPVVDRHAVPVTIGAR